MIYVLRARGWCCMTLTFFWNIAGMLPQPADNVLTPQAAVNQSSTVLFTLTGGRSPDILLFASCLWCAHLQLRRVMPRCQDVPLLCCSMIPCMTLANSLLNDLSLPAAHAGTM